ncbi:DUF2378 family protein [Hyalangium rubrum]|uniref:DUF2378 family protein n=1 Tax=Hyalangium rubrum TaxID=3103134 RepID=A0ABU5GYM9_9BACT|nr:DUF2378 family protein [Hyalangium sp. s54d21]MDY7226293.1 DUF2378 family protein [Hyalangium sp. s54d21]
MIQPNSPAPSTPEAGEAEYERRIALATATDTSRGLFFNGTLSAVKNFGGENALRQCYELLKDKRFERRFIDFSSYPTSDFLRLLHAASKVLGAHLGAPSDTQRWIGRQTTSDFLSSMAGKTLLLLSGNSPKRALNNLPSGYRSSVSYGDRIVTMNGDFAARVSYRRDLMPPLHNEGVLLGVLESVNARNARVRTQVLGLMDYDYELTWE